MATALLVVDVQTSLIADETPNPDEILSAVTSLVGRARAAGAEVVWITDSRVEPDASLHAALAPAPGELAVVKNTPNVFESTGLHAELTRRTVDRVVVCGMQSDFCVTGTTQGAAALGYEVVLVADAHTTHAWDGRDWRAIVAERNAALGALERVTAVASSQVRF